MVEGTDLARFRTGLTYDVSTRTANLLLAEGWAVPVDAAGHDEPALVIPLSQLDRHTVLVIEDDADFREIVSETLRHSGFTVVAARDGREGLEALTQHRPSLVILDLNLPRVSGQQFREAQRRLRDRKLAGVPVIVVSARDDAIEQGRSIGAADTIQKPVDLDRLVRSIERRIGRSRTRHQTAASRTRQTILVVEDDPALLTLYRNAVIAGGFSVVTAGDGVEAPHRIENRAPDLVVLHLGLPRLSGQDVRREIAAPLKRKTPR